MDQLSLSVRLMGFYKKSLPIILLVAFICVVSGCGQQKLDKNELNENNLTKIVERAERKQYKQVVSQFQEIPISEIPNTKLLAENENFYFYFGRASCLYCREFVIENKELLVNRKNFYYIDTEKMSKEEKQLLNIYGIEEIPVVLKVAYNKEMILVDIEKFIEECL